MLALAHGTNDAQKTMGVITLALVANGKSREQRARADLGGDQLSDGDRARTYSGGWRIIRTMGMRIIKMDRRRALPRRPPARP